MTRVTRLRSVVDTHPVDATALITVERRWFIGDADRR
jgi:hypothetical protein